MVGSGEEQREAILTYRVNVMADQAPSESRSESAVSRSEVACLCEVCVSLSHTLPRSVRVKSADGKRVYGLA